MYSQNRVTWYQLSCTLCHQYCHTYMNFWTQNSKTFFFFYLKAICRIPPSNVFNVILTVGRHAIALWVMSVCWVGPSGLESRTVLGLSVGCHDCLGQQPWREEHRSCSHSATVHTTVCTCSLSALSLLCCFSDSKALLCFSPAYI